METLLSTLEVYVDQARVPALLLNILFDSNAQHIHKRLRQNQLQIEGLALFPSASFVSSPRKKALFYFKREIEECFFLFGELTGHSNTWLADYKSAAYRLRYPSLLDCNAAKSNLFLYTNFCYNY